MQVLLLDHKKIKIGEIYYLMNENNNTTFKKAVYTVTDIQQILGIGKNQAYQLVNSGEFPVRQVGCRKLVSMNVFNTWLNSNSTLSMQS